MSLEPCDRTLCRDFYRNILKGIKNSAELGLGQYSYPESISPKVQDPPRPSSESLAMEFYRAEWGDDYSDPEKAKFIERLAELLRRDREGKA